MRDTSRNIGFAVLALALLAGGAAWAEDEDKAFEGNVELIWRNVDVDGNKDKYNEDYDGLSSGGRLGNLWLNWHDGEQGGLNYARVQAQGLGGDPFEYSDIRIGAQGKWDLRYNHRKQDYIYNLYDWTDDEDGHSWDSQKDIDDISLRLYPTKNFDVVLGFREVRRSGNSIFMKDISRDLFLMEAPLDHSRKDYEVGFNWRLGVVDLVFRQTRRDYTNNMVNETEHDLGLENATTLLNAYDWEQNEDATADLTQVLVHAPLGKRLDINFGYYGTLAGEEEFDTHVVVNADGTAFNGSPLVITNGTSDTRTKRDLQYFNLDVAIYVIEPLNIILQADSLEWDQSSVGQHALENQTPDPVATRWDYSIDTLTALAEILPFKNLNVQVGFRTIDRDLERAGFGTARDGSFKSDGDETLVAAVNWRSQYFQVGADYEDGSVDVPLKAVSPYDTERKRVRLGFTPQPDMKIEATFLEVDNDNDATLYPSLANSKISALTFSNRAGTRWDYMLRYARQNVDTSAAVNFDTAAFGGTDNGLSIYTSDNDQFQARLNYSRGAWSAFLRGWWTEADGSNSLTGLTTGSVHNTAIMQDYYDAEIGVTYTLPSGVYVGAAWREFDYQDDANLLLDYDGTILTLRGGFVFGRPKS